MSEHIHDWRPGLAGGCDVSSSLKVSVTFQRCPCGAWREVTELSTPDGGYKERHRDLSEPQCREMEERLRAIRQRSPFSVGVSAAQTQKSAEGP